jgi:hypothetical protein
MANSNSTVPHPHTSPSTTTTTISSTTPSGLSDAKELKKKALKKILRKKFSWKNYPGMYGTDRKCLHTIFLYYPPPCFF